MTTKLAAFNRILNGTGRMVLGSANHGEIGCYGSAAIQNVQFEAAGIDAIGISWEWVAPNNVIPVYVSIYVDGVYVTSTQATDTVIGNLEDGEHQVVLVLEPAHLLGLWTVEDTVTGRRPYISFTGGGNDVIAYLIYWDEATGTVDYTYTWAEVDNVEATHLTSALPTGTGTGRLTSIGDYSGTYPYALYEVVIDTAGAIDEYGGGATYKWRVQTFNPEVGALAWSAFNTLNPIYFEDTVYELDNGIGISFTAGTFVADDTWQITVKCRTYYRHTSDMADGNYKVVVRTEDNAGNRSANTVPVVSFSIDGVPPEPYALAIRYAGNSRIAITCNCPDVADLWAIIITSNGGLSNRAGTGPAMPDKRYSHDMWYTAGVLPAEQPTGYLIGDGIGANEPIEYITGPLPAGHWAFQVLAVDQAGHFSDGATVLTMELRGTPPAYVLSPVSPDGLDAIQEAGGDISLTFNLYGMAADTDRAMSARIYYDAGTGTVDYTDIIATVDNPMGNVWNSVKIRIGGLAHGTTYKFGVRAVSSTDDEDTNTETVSCVSDAIAPAHPETVTVAIYG